MKGGGNIFKIVYLYTLFAGKLKTLEKFILRDLERRAVGVYTLVVMTDSTGVISTQLAIFIRGVDDKCGVAEEMASSVPLQDTTKTRNPYKAFLKSVKVDPSFTVNLLL